MSHNPITTVHDTPPMQTCWDIWLVVFDAEAHKPRRRPLWHGHDEDDAIAAFNAFVEQFDEDTLAVELTCSVTMLRRVAVPDSVVPDFVKDEAHRPRPRG